MSFNNYSGSGPVRRVCLQKNMSQAPTLALNRPQGRGGAAGDPSLKQFQLKCRVQITNENSGGSISNFKTVNVI